MGVSICSGTTVGVAKQNFVQSEREYYKNDIIPVFTRFLKKLYSKFYILCPVWANIYSLTSKRGMSCSGDAWNHFEAIDRQCC